MQPLKANVTSLDRQALAVMNEAASGSAYVSLEDLLRTEGEWDNAINDIIELNERLKELYRLEKTQREPR